MRRSFLGWNHTLQVRKVCFFFLDLFAETFPCKHVPIQNNEYFHCIAWQVPHRSPSAFFDQWPWSQISIGRCGLQKNLPRVKHKRKAERGTFCNWFIHGFGLRTTKFWYIAPMGLFLDQVSQCSTMQWPLFYSPRPAACYKRWPDPKSYQLLPISHSFKGSLSTPASLGRTWWQQLILWSW